MVRTLSFRPGSNLTMVALLARQYQHAGTLGSVLKLPQEFTQALFVNLSKSEWKEFTNHSD